MGPELQFKRLGLVERRHTSGLLMYGVERLVISVFYSESGETWLCSLGLC